MHLAPSPFRRKSLDHKKPSKLKVRLVDGESIRNISQEKQEFGLYGTHYDFADLIPEGEVWIDKTCSEVDQHFFLINAEAYLKARAQGKDEDDAYDFATTVERAERAKDKSPDHGQGFRPFHEEVPADIYLRPWKAIKSDNEEIKVWIVDGLKVRGMLKTDFTQGGHAFQYPWIPEDEIWIEVALKPEEMEFVLIHEFTERHLMKHEELGYDAAHEKADAEEFHARQAHKAKAGQKALRNGTCKRGQRADLTGCIPQVGESPFRKQPVQHDNYSAESAYEFYSPNVEEGLTYEQALTKLDSTEQKQFEALANDVLSQVGLTHEAANAIGDWKDGAENSLVEKLSGVTDPEAVAYSACLIGKAAKQKAVLTFVADPSGADSLYEVTIPEKDIGKLRDVMARQGIEYRTIVPLEDGYRITVYDQGTKLENQISAVGDHYGTDIEQRRGTGEFIGGETREAAADEYTKRIQAYEEKPNKRRYQAGRRLDYNGSAATEAKSLGQHKYGCLMAILPESTRKQITDWALENILDCHVGPGGREPIGHVTIKYGFVGSSEETLPQIKEYLKRFGPITLRLTKLSVFKSGYGKWKNEDGNVLKVEVESDQLRHLNSILSSSFECVDKFADSYQPHCTVAYLAEEPEQISDYYAGLDAPFLNQSIVVNVVEWSGADGDKELIRLGDAHLFDKGLIPAKGPEGKFHIVAEKLGDKYKYAIYGPAGLCGYRETKEAAEQLCKDRGAKEVAYDIYIKGLNQVRRLYRSRKPVTLAVENSRLAWKDGGKSLLSDPEGKKKLRQKYKSLSNDDANYYKEVGGGKGAVLIAGQWVGIYDTRYFEADSTYHNGQKFEGPVVRWQGPPSAEIRRALNRPDIKSLEGNPFLTGRTVAWVSGRQTLMGKVQEDTGTRLVITITSLDRKGSYKIGDKVSVPKELVQEMKNFLGAGLVEHDISHTNIGKIEDERPMPPQVGKSFFALMKDHSVGTCEQGQTAKETGCIPQNGEAGPHHSNGAPPVKRRAAKGKRTSAKREGKGKEAKVLLSNGQPAPAHITPAMVPPAWKRVRISMDPEADILVSAWMTNRKTGKETRMTVYNPKYAASQQAAKFAKISEGLQKMKEMYQQNQKNLNNSEYKEEAAVTWLMQEQATRPGSETDTKGYERLYNQAVTKDNVEIVRKKNKKGKELKPSVVLKFGDEKIPIRDEGTKNELMRRVEAGEDLMDGSYWLKSHGATTLEARNVIDAQDGVRLQFVGKEGVFHDHLIKNQDLGLMLLERKEAAKKPTDKLFNTDYSKVAHYTKTLDGGTFSPKDFRTLKATSLAIDEINKVGDCCASPEDYQAKVMGVAEKVSNVLGNRAAQALESYISPTVWSKWKQNEMAGFQESVDKIRSKGWVTVRGAHIFVDNDGEITKGPKIDG